ncbi:hypothetical protein NQ318_000596 [Aromia moschata]|uniref:Transposase n=1 Tax=Aromia moschata TaxID=1265417 RepID=A0AAV8XR62_9CUCU|nr:hypothetical protein NQ318_000596 [Aromia moschata]
MGKKRASDSDTATPKTCNPPSLVRGRSQLDGFLDFSPHIKKVYVLGFVQRFLTRCENEEDGLLNRKVTCDEKLVHHYTPEPKQASMEWRKKRRKAPVKAKTRNAEQSVQNIVVNLGHMGHRTKVAYRTKRRRSPIRNVVLLHDNARPHTATITQAKLD